MGEEQETREYVVRFTVEVVIEAASAEEAEANADLMDGVIVDVDVEES